MIHEPDNPISNNRRRILEATSQLIAEKGVTNTTVSDIVDRVGISRGTLHYYYKSKNELIYDITTQHLDELSKYWLDKIAQVNEPIEHLPELLKETLESFVHAERPGTLNLT
jgi:AcrR family transcriptional regulator